MKRQWQAGFIVALLLALGPSLVWAQRLDSRSIEVDVVNDRGRAFPQYPVRRDGGPAVYRAYLEAVQGQRYSIQIRNRTNERIGVVIAVDGRNIISGERSNLRRDERMYVIEPNQQETYEGWRTGRDRVNRFYFTDAGDSYADAWGDHSAMGVIAVAAFREVAPPPPPRQPWSEGRDGRREGERGLQSAPPAADAPSGIQRSAPGTGYGEREWSPSRRVEFDPERRPFARYFLKYAWRDTLCQQGVIDCDDRRRPRNRFWDQDEYAPPPPRRDEWR